MKESLDGYTRVEADGAVGLIRDGYAGTLQSAMLNPAKLEDLTQAGRGTVKLCRTPDGHAVVREYRRGGFVRHFLKKHYLFDNRPKRELEVWEYAHAKGLSVPKPLGALWRKRGPYYSGLIASEYIESKHLEDWIKSCPDDALRDAVLQKVGEQFRAMHDLGILHADLQVRNVLVDTSHNVYIIDFDNAQVLDSLSREAGDANLDRFRRSLMKRRIPLPHIVPILLGYGKDQHDAESWLRA